MLVLTRKKGERILIGDDIVVTLIDIRGDGVRIGFDAPRGVPIQRAEVVTAVTEANTEAAATSAATGDLLVGLLSRGRAAAPAEGVEPATERGASTAQPDAEARPRAATESRPQVDPPMQPGPRAQVGPRMQPDTPGPRPQAAPKPGPRARP